MKQTELTKAVDYVVDLKLRAIDYFLENYVEPLLDTLGSPEKVIGKPYEYWSREDLLSAAKIYGPGNDSPLGKLIAKKELEKLQRLEAATE